MFIISYYKKHVKDFAIIAHPFSEIIKTETKHKITWNEQHEKSLNDSKKCLTTELVLRHFDDKKHVFLTTDASILGLGSLWAGWQR